MSAPEPGDAGRRPGVALRGPQTHLRQTGADLRPGAAGPRAVRAVRALHPLQQPDRRRPDDRAGRARRPPAGRHRRGRPLRVVLLWQHHPDLPGRRAHLGRVPLPLPPLRPGLLAVGVRALRGRLRDPYGPPARQGPAAAGRQRPRGQRGVDLRQGEVCLPLRAAEGPAGAPVGTQPGVRRTGTGELAGRPGGRGPGAVRRQGPHRRPDRRPADRRGRLRLRQVRPGRAGHERHRLPGTGAQRRGGRLPGGPGRRPGPGSRGRGPHVHRPGGGTGRPPGRYRGRGGGSRRLPAAAQGAPQERSAHLRAGAVRLARPDQGGRHAAPGGTRHRDRMARRAGRRRRTGGRGRRGRRGAAPRRCGDRRRRAAGRGARRSDRRGPRGHRHRRPPGVDPAARSSRPRPPES